LSSKKYYKEMCLVIEACGDLDKLRTILDKVYLDGLEDGIYVAYGDHEHFER